MSADGHLCGEISENQRGLAFPFLHGSPLAELIPKKSGTGVRNRVSAVYSA
jgi:hypothetical protein